MTSNVSVQQRTVPQLNTHQKKLQNLVEIQQNILQSQTSKSPIHNQNSRTSRWYPGNNLLNRQAYGKEINSLKNKDKKFKIKLRNKNQYRSKDGQQTIFTQEMMDEIKKQLDMNLLNAYAEIEAQPSKHKILGRHPDTYFLPNQVLKGYVKSIYSEYEIDDPIQKKKLKKMRKNKSVLHNYSNLNQKSVKKTENHFQILITPPKLKRQLENNQITQLSNLNSKQYSSQIKKRSKTLQKVYNLKKDMFQELSYSRQLSENIQERPTIKKNCHMQSNSRLKPIKNTQLLPYTKIIKVSLKLKKNKAQKTNIESQNNLQIYQNQSIPDPYIFCFMCEKKLIINQSSIAHNKKPNILQSHRQNCKELKKFMEIFHPHLPPTKTLTLLICQKVTSLKEDLKIFQKDLNKEIHIVEEQLNQLVRSKTAQTQSEQLSQNMQSQSTSITRSLKLDKMTQQCWQRVTKLEWFKGIQKLLKSKTKQCVQLGLVNMGLIQAKK